MFSLLFVIYNFYSLCQNFLPSEANYVPALLWTSRLYQDRTYLKRNQIDSALFKSYLSEIISKGQPVVIVFLEPYLTFRDPPTFGITHHPFLGDLSKDYRIDKFENVESPYQVLVNLTTDTYTWNKWTMDADLKEFTAWTYEFNNTNGSRSEMFKAHSTVISAIDKNLKTLGKEWIALYTGKTGSTEPKPRSTWYLEAEEEIKPQRAISVYQDEYTGFTAIIRGRIQLFLPSTSGDFTAVHLGNHSSASEKRSDLKGKINFVLTFPNYTFTFCIGTVNRDWVIEKIKIANEEGDSLSLMANTRILLPQHKCIDHFYEFQSLKQPFIKVKIAKYKFVRLAFNEESCTPPYRFHVISSFMFLSIMTIALFWDALFKSGHLPKKSKIVRVPTETLLSIDQTRQLFNLFSR